MPITNYITIGGVPISGFISPGTTADDFPVIDTTLGIDGLRNYSGNTIEVLSGTTITELRRRAGMIVGVEGGDQYFKLKDKDPWDFDLTDWEEIFFSGGDGSPITGGTAFPTTQTLTFYNSSGGTFNVLGAEYLFSDLSVTGGTYNGVTGIVTFYTNSGTTFEVGGFLTISADTFVTGATLNGDSLEIGRNQSKPLISVDLSSLKFSGSTFSWSDPVVKSGNTSGDCIDVLWVSTISGCSPVTIGSSIQSPGSTASGLHSIAYGGSNVIDSDYTMALGGSDNNIGTGSTSSGIFGGSENTINSDIFRSIIIGGENNEIFKHITVPTVSNNIILGGTKLSGTSVFKNCALIGGENNEIFGLAMAPEVFNTVVLGGSGIKGGMSNSVYVPKLNIGTVGDGPSEFNLGIDSSGFVVTGSTSSGSTFSWSDPVVKSGNTSGDCITDLYVSNIHPCSPLNIIPNSEDNLFIGSGFTFDLTTNVDQRLGINTASPEANLHIKGLTPPLFDNLFLIEDSNGDVVMGANDEGALAIGVDPHELAMSGESSLFIKGDSSTTTGPFDDVNIALRVVNSSNNNILLVKNGDGVTDDGTVAINGTWYGGPFASTASLSVYGSQAGSGATLNTLLLADMSSNTLMYMDNGGILNVASTHEWGRLQVGQAKYGRNAKLHVGLSDNPTNWDTYFGGDSKMVIVDGLSDAGSPPFTTQTPNIFVVDNFGNVNVKKRTTTENFTMTSGPTAGYVLTSDVSGNASWQPSSGATGGGYLTHQKILTKSDILEITGDTGPIEIMAAPGPGKFIDINTLTILGNVVGTGYTYDCGIGSKLFFQLGGLSTGFTYFQMSPDIILDSQDRFMMNKAPIVVGIGSPANLPLNLYGNCKIEDPTGTADGTMVITVEYKNSPI